MRLSASLVKKPDEHIGEGEKSCEDVVLDDRADAVLEEQVCFSFIDI